VLGWPETCAVRSLDVGRGRRGGDTSVNGLRQRERSNDSAARRPLALHLTLRKQGTQRPRCLHTPLAVEVTAGANEVFVPEEDYKKVNPMLTMPVSPFSLFNILEKNALEQR
jgi:hypothetical protein